MPGGRKAKVDKALLVECRRFETSRRSIRVAVRDLPLFQLFDLVCVGLHERVVPSVQETVHDLRASALDAGDLGARLVGPMLGLSRPHAGWRAFLGSDTERECSFAHHGRAYSEKASASPLTA